MNQKLGLDMENSLKAARMIYEASTPVLQIHGLFKHRWKRNTGNGPQGLKDKRIGPWMQANYTVMNSGLWAERRPCLYMVQSGDAIRYVGISKNRLKDRWRLSPAYDAHSGLKLPENQLFHSQCWPHVEAEFQTHSGTLVEVRAIQAPALGRALKAIGDPLAAFAAFADDEQSMVACMERWFCNRSCEKLATWNVAMTLRTH